MRTRTPFTVALLTAALILGGCASTADYQAYSQGQAAIEQAKYAAEAARFKAMSDIAASGDPSAKVAAVVALAMSSGGGQGGGQQSAQLRAPEPPGQTVLQWASVLVPALTQGYSIYSNTRLGMQQSNNNARVAESTNNAFLGMATNIKDTSVAGSSALTNMANANNTALVQLGTNNGNALSSLATSSNTALLTLGQNSNSSLVQLGQSGNNALVGLGQANGAGLTALANALPNLQPNVTYTLSGTGVIGSGTYTGPVTTTRTNVVGGNGVAGNGTNTTTPAPVVITPVVTPAPVITPVVINNP